jgi:hypothetical protein
VADSNRTPAAAFESVIESSRVVGLYCTGTRDQDHCATFIMFTLAGLLDISGATV